MTPNAHSTQRRYIAAPPAPPARDPKRRAQLFRHLGFVITHVAATVKLHGFPMPKTKADLRDRAKVWRDHFRDVHLGGRSATTLEDDPLHAYVYDVEQDAIERLKVTFPEGPAQ